VSRPLGVEDTWCRVSNWPFTLSMVERRHLMGQRDDSHALSGILVVNRTIIKPLEKPLEMVYVIQKSVATNNPREVSKLHSHLRNVATQLRFAL
jgi:hypothetical protein